MFLSATAQLQRNVNVKQIVISLIDRFANFAARAREETRGSVASADSSTPAPVPNGIPDDVELFTIFWSQITELIKVSISSLSYHSCSWLTPKEKYRHDLN